MVWALITGAIALTTTIIGFVAQDNQIRHEQDMSRQVFENISATLEEPDYVFTPSALGGYYEEGGTTQLEDQYSAPSKNYNQYMLAAGGVAAAGALYFLGKK